MGAEGCPSLCAVARAEAGQRVREVHLGDSSHGDESSVVTRADGGTDFNLLEVV